MKKICILGLIGVMIGLVLTMIGLIFGLILGLNDLEIINNMSIGLVIFLGGMILVLYCQMKQEI